MIACFVSNTTEPTSAIFLSLIYSCFDIVLMALFCATIRRDPVSLLRFPFLSHVSYEISLFCRLRCLYKCFSFHFCYFSGYICSVDACVVGVVSGDCNQYSSAVFYVVSLFREFFPPVLADGLSLKFKWHQVFSSLQDSSQYSGRSWLCCNIDRLYLSYGF